MNAPGWQSDTEALLPSRLAGRLAAILYSGVAGAVILLNAALPDYSAADRRGMALAGLALIAIGLVLWRLPWQHWPRRALLLIVPLGLVSMAVFNLTVPLNPYHYEIYALPLFGWIGLTCRRGTALATLPLLAPTYLIPLKVTGHLSRDSAVALIYIALFCALQGEGLAWLAERLTQAQGALKRSEALYRALSEQASDIVSVVDAQGRFAYVSPSVRTIMGLDPDALLGTSFFDLLHPDDLAMARERLERGATTSVETRTLHADGSWRWLEHTIQDARDDPLVRGFIATGRDISARKAADDALRTSEQRFRTLVEEAPIGIMIIDAHGVLEAVNPALCAISGYAEDELLGRPFTAIIPPEQAAALARRYTERFAQEVRVDDECQVPAKDGRLITVLSAAVFLTNLAGEPRRAAFIIDITGRKQEEQERERLLAQEREVRQRAEQAEARLGAIVEASPLPILTMDLAGRVQSWNGAAERTFGWRAEEVIGSALPVVPPEEQIAFAGLLARVALGEVLPTIEVRRVRKDGATIELQVSTAPLHDAEGRIVGAMAVDMDITARKQMERELAQSGAAAEELARLRQEQAHAAEAMAEVSAALGSALDNSDLYALILQQAGKVLPLDHAQILAPDEDWLMVVAQYGEPAVPAGTRLFQVSDAYSNWLRLQQGRPLLVRDTEDDPEWQDVPPRIGPYRLRSLISIPLMVDGSLVGLFEIASMAPNFYSDRHIQIATVFGDRITQALRNVRLFEAEQQRARAAEALAQLRSDFVASVSHELRTPLTAIVGFAELLQSYWAAMSETRRREQIDRIAIAANRQQRLVEDLLLLSQLEGKAPAMQIQPLLLAPLIQRAATELGGSYAGQQVDLGGPGDLRAVADAGRTVQILANLLDNAAKYSLDGSPIAVSWGLEDAGVVVRVRDSGPGVPEEGRELLFTRFGRLAGSRMRAGRVGTGLGLYLGRELARAMGGDLELEATGPEGSTFRLRLPAEPSAAQA